MQLLDCSFTARKEPNEGKRLISTQFFKQEYNGRRLTPAPCSSLYMEEITENIQHIKSTLSKTATLLVSRGEKLERLEEKTEDLLHFTKENKLKTSKDRACSNCPRFHYCQACLLWLARVQLTDEDEFYFAEESAPGDVPWL